MAKKNVLTIDFSKEEDSGGGGRINWDDGDYHVQIVKAKAGRSSQKDTPKVDVTFKVLEGKRKGKTFTESLYLTSKSLKRLRLLLEAVGVKVPKSALKIPLDKLKGKKLWVELITESDDEYGDKSKVAFEGFMSEEDYEAPDDDEDDDEDEDEDDELDDDEDEEDEDEEDEDDDDEDEDDEEEDEEEEEVKPKSKKRAAKKTKKSSSKKSSKKKSKKDDDDDEIEELDLDEL